MKKGTVSDRLILKNRAVDLFSNVPRVFAVFVDPRGIPANRCHPKCAENLIKTMQTSSARGLMTRFGASTLGPKSSLGGG